MSYTSVYGRWLDSEGAALFVADEPVSVYRCQILANNIHHLRDTSTAERVSHLTMVGETITATDATGDSNGNSVPLLQYTTHWSILGANKLARPVLRVGAYRGSAGTSYLSAGLFPYGTRHNAFGIGALAWWDEVSFTATTPTIIIEDAADITWKGRATPPQSGSGFMTVKGSDPENDGTMIPSRVPVMVVTLALFVRHTATAEVRVSLVQLREFSGP